MSLSCGAAGRVKAIETSCKNCPKHGEKRKKRGMKKEEEEKKKKKKKKKREREKKGGRANATTEGLCNRLLAEVLYVRLRPRGGLNTQRQRVLTARAYSAQRVNQATSFTKDQIREAIA
jgi:hypothetical protein